MSPLVGGRWVFLFSIFHFIYQTREGSSWTLDSSSLENGPGSTGRVRVSDPWRGKGRGGASDRRIGREAQRQEVGSNFRNTTGNTIDILSAIDFAKRLQAAATSGKEAMPNEQSKVYTRRPLAFEKLSEAQDRQLRECGDESHVAWLMTTEYTQRCWRPTFAELGRSLIKMFRKPAKPSLQIWGRLVRSQSEAAFGLQQEKGRRRPRIEGSSDLAERVVGFVC